MKIVVNECSDDTVFDHVHATTDNAETIANEIEDDVETTPVSPRLTRGHSRRRGSRRNRNRWNRRANNISLAANNWILSDDAIRYYKNLEAYLQQMRTHFSYEDQFTAPYNIINILVKWIDIFIYDRYCYDRSNMPTNVTSAQYWPQEYKNTFSPGNAFHRATGTNAIAPQHYVAAHYEDQQYSHHIPIHPQITSSRYSRDYFSNTAQESRDTNITRATNVSPTRSSTRRRCLKSVIVDPQRSEEHDRSKEESNTTLINNVDNNDDDNDDNDDTSPHYTNYCGRRYTKWELQDERDNDTAEHYDEQRDE